MTDKIWIAAAIALMVVGCAQKIVSVKSSSTPNGDCTCEILIEEADMTEIPFPIPIPLPRK